MISKTDKNLTGIEQLRALVAITKKISESLKYQLTAEQIDVLVEEHKQVMAKLAKVPKAEMKQHQDLLKNIQKQVQFVQKELDNYHDAVKDKLISFGKKRKQINAYNALA